ncbi:MAG: hypothetical protein LLF76_11020 [Planctomycetaceae bacterium]|nr:hypothetical protein [Planctomycetaceae bacterium]
MNRIACTKRCLTPLFLMVCLAGCRSPLNKYEGVFDRYYATTLGMSTSSDVLATIQDPKTEYLSQSESVVASWGKAERKDRTHWFNMVAFDEEQMTAVRKYGFILEETTWGLNRTPLPALRFDGEMVMSSEVLDAAYANNNAKLLAVLSAARDLFKKDATEVTYESDVLRSSTMMVYQAFNSVINRLTQSPAYAVKLPELEGMEFDHPTLGESRIRMVIEDQVVKVKIKAGKWWFVEGPAELPWIEKPFEKHQDVLNM